MNIKDDTVEQIIFAVNKEVKITANMKTLYILISLWPEFLIKKLIVEAIKTTDNSLKILNFISL